MNSFQNTSFRNLEQKKLHSDDDQIEHDLKIEKCTFDSNTVKQSGGAISIKELNVKILDVNCTGIESKQEGGCINYKAENKQQNKKFLLINTKMFINIAQICGGVRVIGTEAILKNQSEIQNNIAKKYGQDYLSYLMGVSTSLNKNGITKELGRSFGKTIIDVDNWVTGQDDKINGYFVIQFLDINQIQMIVPDAQVELSLDDSEVNNSASKIDGIKSLVNMDLKLLQMKQYLRSSPYKTQELKQNQIQLNILFLIKQLDFQIAMILISILF